MMTNQPPEEDFELDDELEEEDSVAINYDIASYPSDHTLSGIFSMWNEGDITIPDFQRQFVWTIRQSSLLIDSFLSGLPIPNIFFYIDEENRNLVIDGQQRIMSVVYFFEGYFGEESTQGKRRVFRLTGLGDDSPYDGKQYQDLRASDQRKLKQAVLRAVNIRQLSPVGESTSTYHIFERLNTGGTPLSPQEIRNVVYRGDFNQSLKEANLNPNWREIIGRPFKDKRQKDIEFLLRVFALVGDSDKYEKPMKEFLNVAMTKHRNGDTQKVANFIEVFPEVTEMVDSELGPKPFHLRGPLNISALGSVMSVLVENYEKIDRNELKQRFSALRADADFDESTSFNTTDAVTVEARINVVRKYLLKK